MFLKGSRYVEVCMDRQGDQGISRSVAGDRQAPLAGLRADDVHHRSGELAPLERHVRRRGSRPPALAVACRRGRASDLGRRCLHMAEKNGP